MKTGSQKKGSLRKITKTAGYTYYVTIPKEELLALGWRERQRVLVKRVGKRLVVERLKG